MKGAGCLFTVAAVVVVAGALVGMATGIYGAVKADEQADMQKHQADLASSRSKVAQRMSMANDKKAVEQAARMAADGTMLDMIMTKQANWKTRNAKAKLRDSGNHTADPRPARNFGTPTVVNPGNAGSTGNQGNQGN
jgi:hypothetical protein